MMTAYATPEFAAIHRAKLVADVEADGIVLVEEWLVLGLGWREWATSAGLERRATEAGFIFRKVRT